MNSYARDDPSNPPGRLFPVCCAAPNISPEVLDRFLDANQMYRDQLQCFFVFVDDLETAYVDESEIGETEEPTSSSSPFIGKSPAECHELLRKLWLEAKADIDCCAFAILDPRSLQDDTVLLVQAPWEGEEGEIKSVRVDFEIAHFHLGMYNDGEFFTIDDDIKTAQEAEDGVLRAAMVDARFKRQEEECLRQREAALKAQNAS